MSDAKKYTGKLSGQRVLVIGGTSGLGYGVAEALLEHGCEVIISSSSTEKVNKSLAELSSSYPSSKGRLHGHVCNLGGNDALEQIGNLFSKVGKLDHVVYTAADSLKMKPLEDFTLSTMQQAGMVRFFGPLLVAQQLKKYLNAGPASSFTITSGQVAEHPHPNWAIINAYATGIYGMTRALALDLAPIRVNAVSPGLVDTELWDFARDNGSFEKIETMFRDKSTTGAVGKVEDVVQGYLYLLKDHNISGRIIGSDGGASLK